MAQVDHGSFSLPDNCPGLTGCPATLSLSERIAALEKRVVTDALTGLWNRMHFDSSLDPEIRRSLRHKQPLSLILFDVDHFKDVNDGFGHQVGDQVLCELARVASLAVRTSDRLFRWGGEEFAVLATASGHRGSARVAENLREAVATHGFPGVGRLTVSIGVAEHLASESADEWFHRADVMLYAAKCGGRNTVRVDARGNSDLWAAAHGTSALHLVWQEAYECGEPSVDAEHIHLFELANRTIDAAARQDRDPLGFSASLDTLLQHVQSHFAAEESLLARHHYIDLEPHRRAHAGLLRRAADLKAQAVVGGASLGSVVEFLAQEVVARHIMVVDRAFYPLFDRYVGRSELQP